MTKKIVEMRQKRAQLIKDGRALLDAAEKDGNRDLTAEERSKYDAIMADVDKIADRVQAEERQSALENDLEKTDDSGVRTQPETENEEQSGHPTDSKEYRKAWRDFLHATDERGTGLIKLRNKYVESRALQMDSDIQGGYVIAPQQFANQVVLKKKDLVFVRNMATVIPMGKAESLGVPTLATEPEDLTWSGEITARDEETAMNFGKRELFPHPMNKLLKVSKKLLRASVIDVEALVRDRIAYKQAVTEETAFLTGSGAQQPLGVFTASNDGISTSQDISTGNTNTSIQTDGLFEAKYGLKQQYRQNCAWIFHRDAVKQIMKLKDGEGDYLLKPDLRSAVGLDRLLGFPVYESEYAPNTFTSGLYVGILGDFSYYWIADALTIQIQRLVELYAATNQDGFIAISETDGMPIQEEAFVRVTLA